MDLPFLKTSVVTGSAPLNIMQENVTELTWAGERVRFCPHVKSIYGKSIIGWNNAGTRYGSPIQNIRHTAEMVTSS